MGMLMNGQAAEAIDVIADKHSLSYVREGGCCSTSEVTCECAWQGGPSDYSTHLLVALGESEVAVTRWRAGLNRYGGEREVEYSLIQIEEYLNVFRGPKNKRRITREERKTGVLV